MTGGTGTGVMKMVGNMIQKAGADAPVCLGITPWGCVRHHENMAKLTGGRIYSYAKVADDPRRQGQIPAKERRANLDANHSHFILVEDGSKGEFGGEREMRANIENLLCAAMPKGQC